MAANSVNTKEFYIEAPTIPLAVAEIAQLQQSFAYMTADTYTHAWLAVHTSISSKRSHHKLANFAACP